MLQETLERALELDGQGEMEAAIRCLDTVAGEIPHTAAHQKFVGMLYQRLGADGKSHEFLARALDLAPDDGELHLAMGYHCIDNADHRRAVACFTEHLRLDPGSLTGHVHLGRANDFLGQFDEALEALEAARALDPRALEPLIHRGRVLIRTGRYADALESFTEAGRLDPGHIMPRIGSLRAKAFIEGRAEAVPRRSDAPPATVACVKYGPKYGPDYVNRLASMARRWSTHSPRFVCFTDDPGGLDGGIEHRALPADGLYGWWNKVALFRRDLPGIEGRVLYLDLDVVITGDLDSLLCYASDFAIMDNDYVPGFNTSVMLFEAGSRPEIWQKFDRSRTGELIGDQDWLGLSAPDADLWPDQWCVPFRLRAARSIPAETKVVCFCGKPNPHDSPAPWITD